jgi:predicted MFS family arabinose efflux permease
LNNRLLALALGTFAIGTGSFVFAGLLEGVAEDLSVSVATAGHLVTVFALSLNASAIYLGQGAGAFLGALALDLGSLGWTGALCTLLSLAVLVLGTRSKGPGVAPEG